MKLFKNRKNRLKNFKITRLEDMTIMVAFNTKGGESAKLYLSSSDDKDMFYEQIIKAINIVTNKSIFNNTCNLIFNDIKVILTKKDIYMVAEKAMKFPRFYSKEICIYDKMIDDSVYTIYADDYGLRFNVLKSMNDNMEYSEEYEFTFTGLTNIKHTFYELINSYNTSGGCGYKSVSDIIEVETDIETDNMNGVKLKNSEPKIEKVYIEITAKCDGSVHIKEVFEDKIIYLFKGNIYDIKNIINSIEEIEDEILNYEK